MARVQALLCRAARSARATTNFPAAGVGRPDPRNHPHARASKIVNSPA